MTAADPKIIALQEALNAQGASLTVDGRYGEQTAAAYAQYLDQDPAVPTIVPPIPKAWWHSKTALSLLATILVSLASLAGITLDGAQLTEALGAATTLVLSLMALWANARRDAPLDRSLVLPGVRLGASAPQVQADGEPNREPGPFGY